MPGEGRGTSAGTGLVAAAQPPSATHRQAERASYPWGSGGTAPEPLPLCGLPAIVDTLHPNPGVQTTPGDVPVRPMPIKGEGIHGRHGRLLLDA